MQFFPSITFTFYLINLKMKFFIFGLSISMCSASNILLLFPMSVKSHVNSFFPMFQKLSDNGHNLTMVINFKTNKFIPNCTYIEVNNPLEHHFLKVSSKEVLSEHFSNDGAFAHWPVLWKLYNGMTETFLKEASLDQLILGNNTFDLMISETLYLQELFVSLGYIFNVPVISIDAHAPNAWSCYLTGNVNSYSYVPSYKLMVTDHMSFIERFQNMLLNLEVLLGSYYYYLPNQEKLMRKHLSYGKYNFPPLIDMLKNTSLTLVDYHFFYGYIRPYTPNVIEVGGMMFKSADILNEEYQKLMDESTDGVIYFTLGSLMNMTFLPDETIKIFTSAFAKLNQSIIMKWENKNMPYKPKNVITSAWLPQNGILAHPNCRLFITHGGVHRITEAIYHKVPLLVIPFFSDQHHNARFAEKEGFAYVLSNRNLTVENLLYAINAAIDNPVFKRNIEKRSLILKDRALSSVDTAVYWVEYVVRHKGAKHLKPASLDLNTFQYFLLDVILLIFIAIVTSIYIIYYILHSIFKFFKTISRYRY